MRSFLLVFVSLLLGTIFFPSQLQAAPQERESAHDVSSESLKKLEKLIQDQVDSEQIVGAEILVIQHGKKLLHRGFGWQDREAEVEMETGNVFCVRSMTKPLIGTSILMLIADGKLNLDDKAAKFLPSFDVENTKHITIEHLLTHTSGLPMSLLVGKDLKTLNGIQDVAKLGGGYELDSKPGKRFQYSDQGTDTLTAIVEVVSGMPASDFVETRILQPLGMSNSTCVLSQDHRLRARAINNYAGSAGAWSEYWNPTQPPLFPFFLGSQGLYSTTEDYTRFLEFWGNEGLVNGNQLLSPSLIKKALTSNPQRTSFGSGLPGTQADYGYLMQMWLNKTVDSDNELIAFGHSGSDGTYAWTFPNHSATVMYFTQSRGNTTGPLIEAALGELFLGVPFDINRKPTPPMEEFLGYYWEGEGDLYRAIIRDGEDMALEIAGRAIVPLDFVSGDSWKFRANPNIVIEFDRSETDGKVSGYHIGDHQEFRFTPSKDLPSGEQVAEQVAKTHQIDRLEKTGPIQLLESLSIEKLGLKGTATTTFAWPNLFRQESEIANQFERSAYDGEKAWYHSSAKKRAQLTGPKVNQAKMASHSVRFGDWSHWYSNVQVIQRLQGPDGEVYVVRVGDTSAPASTFYVVAEEFRVFREDSVVHIDMMGRVGQRTTFGDFRKVSEMLIPFQTKVEIAHPLMGPIVSIAKVTETKVDVETSEGMFQLKD